MGLYNFNILFIYHLALIFVISYVLFMCFVIRYVNSFEHKNQVISRRFTSNTLSISFLTENELKYCTLNND